MRLAVFCALSLWLLVHTLKNIIKYEPSKRWPHVIGEVTSCDAIQLVPSQGQQRDLILEYAMRLMDKLISVHPLRFAP